MSCDGVVQPHPPIRRALDIVREALKSRGHGIIDWNPPSHARGIEIVQTCWLYDGGVDVHRNFRLSGEPISEQIGWIYGSQPTSQLNASAIAQNNIAKRAFQKEYMEYWNSTSKTLDTGRPVDAVILPAGAAVATRQGTATYGGYTTALSALDWTVITVPVTSVIRQLDIVDSDFSPLSELDARVHKGCRLIASSSNFPQADADIRRRPRDLRRCACVASGTWTSFPRSKDGSLGKLFGKDSCGLRFRFAGEPPGLS